MTPHLSVDPHPLRVDESGTIRVGKTRITLDLLVHQYHKGSSPEKIVHSYDTLQLSTVYAAIGYYLNHREELDAYLRRREEEADRLEQEIKAKQPNFPSKEELLRRWAEINKKRSQPPMGGKA